MSTTLFGKIDQIGYLVTDIDRSIEQRIALTGIGPWTVFRNVDLHGLYRGTPTHVTMDVALAYQDDIQIELIQVTNDARSPYRTADGAAIIGIHHIAWIVDDLQGVVAASATRGLTVAFEAENPATKVAYLENRDDPGVLYELIEGPSMREMMRNGIAAAREWDGLNPVVTFDLAA